MINNIETPEITKASNGHLLMDSGFIVTFTQNSDVTFSVTSINDNQLKIKISFEDDNSGEQTIQTDSDEDTVYIKCKNLKRSSGSGTKELLKLGKYKGKDIHIGFWIYTLGSLKKIEYCFFIEQ